MAVETADSWQMVDGTADSWQMVVGTAESWQMVVGTAESWQMVDAGIVESWIEVVDRADC